MDLLKQYLAQSITAASNSLRLNTHQLESVGLLRECLVNSTDIGDDIVRMKRITELSRLAIRLNEIYSYLSKNKIDFFKFSEKFKEHSQYLIKDLNHFLEIDDPAVIKNALSKLSGAQHTQAEKEVNVNLTSEKTDSEQLIKSEKNTNGINTINDGSNINDGIFKNYENLILKPIKPLDILLKKLAKNEINYEDVSRFAEIMRAHAKISKQNGFEIIGTMHNIVSKALLMIKSRELMPGKHVIESMRACLIVIVAVVKGKDVDITNYLDKAEDFEKEIQPVTS